MKRNIHLILLFTFCIVFNAKSQTRVVENLVFEGAGIRGLAFAGAISELENNKILPGVKRVAGTSAGAITAVMLSLGYTSNEIISIVSTTRFNKFNDGNYLFAGGINRLNKYFGWYRGKRFEEWIAAIINAKTGNPDITFLKMKEQGFKDLYITGTSLDQQKLFIFSYETFPQMRVRDAVRISMSIPFYFEPLYMNSSGEVFKRPADKQNLLLMVDGGFTANFPIRLFDSTKYTDNNNPNTYVVNQKTIGFRVDREVQITNDSAGMGLASMPVTNLKEYMIAFFTLINENLNRQTLTRDDWERTVSISDGNILPRIRKLSKSELTILIDNGKRGTINYLRK